jgi:hypothetical protein
VTSNLNATVDLDVTPNTNTIVDMGSRRRQRHAEGGDHVHVRAHVKDHVHVEEVP